MTETESQKLLEEFEQLQEQWTSEFKIKQAELIQQLQLKPEERGSADFALGVAAGESKQKARDAALLRALIARHFNSTQK